MVYTKEKNVRVTVEFEVPQINVLGPTLFIDMVQWVFALGEAKEVL